MKEQPVSNLLNDLVEVFYNNFIFYVPSEIIYEGVINSLKGDFDESFFDQLSLLSFEGIAHFDNDDILELNAIVIEKKSLLENNIFILLEKNKELSPIAFEIIIKKYFDQLMLYVFLSEWLIVNLKKYNKEAIHISIIGTFKIQHENFHAHLKELYSYFESLLDTEKTYNFSTEKLLTEHIPDLISRYSQSGNKKTSETNKETDSETETKIDKNEQQLKKKKVARKKIRPIINDKEIENMILERIFNVKTK